MRGLRRAVELAIGRILRSRYGLAALLAVVVVAVLGSARLVIGPADGSPPVVGAPRQPITTVDPHAGDDGLTSPRPPRSPAVSPGAAKPLAVARAFAAAWLRHRNVRADEWREGLLPHSTEALTEQLAESDPAGVPADRITGEPQLIPGGAEFADVAVPLDSGRLILRLIAPDGRWLVDGVDWERT
jgi:hypothetical protein